MLFFILFIALLTTVAILIKKLRAKNRILCLNDVIEENFFAREINTLTVILLVFSISYIFRVIFDVVIGFHKQYAHSYLDYMLAILSCIPFDILPITVILIYHRRNLRQSTSKRLPNRFESSVLTMPDFMDDKQPYETSYHQESSPPATSHHRHSQEAETETYRDSFRMLESGERERLIES